MNSVSNDASTSPKPIRHLCLVLGDQLDADSLIWQNFSAEEDVVWMAEVSGESEQVASSKTRTLYFLSAMRHFAEQLREQGKAVAYYSLARSQALGLVTFTDALQETLKHYQPQQIRVVLAGDYRVKQEIDAAAKTLGIAIEWLADQHFLAQQGEFSDWLKGRKAPVMEYWYRALRKRLNVLMDSNGKPVGGKWNYDSDNRKAFGKEGPQDVPKPRTFELDEISNSVQAEVTEFLQLTGDDALHYWPVTREQALQVLEDFITHRLARFGDHQDAMWSNQPWLFHSRLSAAINVKLLHPMEVVKAAEQAYVEGKAPLNAVEGFIRQIVGWREYVRGLYWSYRDDWMQMNALNAQQDMPSVYWTGKSSMRCMQQSVSQVLNFGYGHHIQRLMVTGLFGLLYGIKPEHMHEWYLAMYVDAIAWVEIPNTLGMSQFADGGIVGSKPYIASGAYVDRMSNYCKQCPYSPKIASGETACPMTTLYWDFIARHIDWLEGHPRLGMQVKNWQRKSEEEQQAIRMRAQQLFKDTSLV